MAATAKTAKTINPASLGLFDEILGNINATRTALEVRPYQRRLCAQTLDFVNEGIKSVMLESPTGSGKTPIGLLIAKMLYQKFGWRCGWVCMNRTLLEQAAAENIARGIDVEGIKFISMFEKDPPTDVDFIIHDEAQHDAASNAARLHNLLKPRFILGMSATPYRTDSVKLCFEKVCKDIGIAQLIKQGYLSPYRHFAIKDWNVSTVVNTYLDGGLERWGKSFLFFLDTEQCEEAQRLLYAAGIRNSEVVTGKTDRHRQLEDFRKGDLKLLIGMKTIAEGVNAPDLHTVFIRDSQRGPTIQMAGRVFRIFKDIPVKQIVQSEKTKYPMVKTALPVEQWLNKDGVWRSLKPNPKINNIVMQTTLMMGRMVSPPINKYLADRQGKKNRWKNK